MKQPTLVEKALAVKVNLHPPRKPRETGDADLCIAWLKGDVSSTQVARAFSPAMDVNKTSSWTRDFIAGTLRLAFQSGEITIIQKTKAKK